MTWRRRIEPLLRPAYFALSRLRRGLTLGVRGLVTDADGRVLLVEHTYVRGWHMPGGGVERGETAESALRRELQEEAGVELTSPPVLISLHDNSRRFPGDHVLVYRCEDWRPVPASAQGEILAVGWFDPGDLPPTTTEGTRARIREALHGAPAAPDW